jgi:hypothetical protein
MALEKPLLMHGFKAASDMSAASQQFIFVKLDTSGNVHPCTAVGDIPIGVLQNRPERDQTAEVMLAGVTKLRAGATDLAIAAIVAVDATSRAAAVVAGTTGTSSYLAGKVIAVDAADNDGALVTATINCLNAGRGQ